jgi:glycosyltransferase involved in cell wall biosynthesis
MLAYTFYEFDGRVSRYAESLAKRGDSVDVIALKLSDEQSYFESLNNVNVYRIQKRDLKEKNKFSFLIKLIIFFFNSSIFLTKRHLQKPYDLIHVHSVPDFLVFATFLAKLKGAKIILDIHDIVPEFYASKFGSGKSSITYKLLVLIEKVSIAFADHVIIANHIWEKILISRSVRNGKCTVIMNYPDPEIFFKRNRSRENNKFIMLYPGSLNWHQGVDIAVKAFALIKDEVPNAEFHIYGDCDLFHEYFKRLISNLGLEGQVFLKRNLPITKIADVMANSDIGIVPKRNDFFAGEAFSTKILEFMAMGIPLIVSATKIDTYYFDHNLVKFFKPEDENDLAESMLLLINNSELRKRLAVRAFEYTKKNNWGVKRHIYLNLVESLVNSKGNQS